MSGLKDSSLICDALVSPEKSIFQFLVRQLLSHKKTVLLVDAGEPLNIADTPILELNETWPT